MSLITQLPCEFVSGSGTGSNSPAESVDPLGEEHHTLLRQAVAARRPVRKVAGTARTSAITTLLIGAASVPFVIFSPSAVSLLVVAGICTVGVVEYRGAQRIRRGEPDAAVLLGRNQMAFLTLIVAYCVIQMAMFSADSASASLISPEVRSQLSQAGALKLDIEKQIDFWAPIATYGFYTLVIAVTAAVQGRMAYYYFSRRRHLQTLQDSTPPWVQRLFLELGV